MQPESVLEWARNMIANKLATDAPSWTQIFSRYNSGTYNNEWMIIDYNLVVSGQPLKPNTFWVLDQVSTIKI